jgi:hypothetical protein
VEHAQAMLIASELPGSLWGEAVMHATWLKNRVSTCALPNKTPFEAATGQKPNLGNIHEFSCQAFVHISAISKLDAKSAECRWVGFDSNSLGHRIYWPESGHISIERDVRFILESNVVLPEGESIPVVQNNEQQSAKMQETKLTATHQPQKLSSPNPLHNFEPEPATGRGHRTAKPSDYVL